MTALSDESLKVIVIITNVKGSMIKAHTIHYLGDYRDR